jgi:hypothetical protein
VRTFNDLCKLAVTIDSKEGHHLGSGCLVVIKEKFYVMTAAHCVCLSNQKQFDTSTLKIVSQHYGHFNLRKQKINRPLIDAVLLEVEEEVKFDEFPVVNYTSDVNFPNLQFCFRGKDKSPSQNSYTVYNCSINGIGNNNELLVAIPLQHYTDFKGETGAEVLDGYSGSALITQDTRDIYICGVVCSVSNDNFSGVNCISISEIQSHLEPKIEVIKDLPNTSDLVLLDVNKLRDQITNEILNSAKENNNLAVNNLTRKMDLFIPGWDRSDLEGFISDMLTWEALYKSKVKGNPKFKKLIDESKSELSAGNKKFCVDDAREGNKRFHDIQENFKVIIARFLENHPTWNNYVATISEGEIAKYLANCKLDFR